MAITIQFLISDSTRELRFDIVDEKEEPANYDLLINGWWIEHRPKKYSKIGETSDILVAGVCFPWFPLLRKRKFMDCRQESC